MRTFREQNIPKLQLPTQALVRAPTQVPKLASELKFGTRVKTLTRAWVGGCLNSGAKSQAEREIITRKGNIRWQSPAATATCSDSK